MRLLAHIRCVVATVVILFSSGLQAQVTVGDSLHTSLDGSLAVGYLGANGNIVQSTNSLSVGGEADLRGDYLDPRVINFVISPYYNLSRANSSIQSIFDASGLNASTQIFSGSRYPGSISFGKGWNHEGEYGLPGTVAYKTRGTDQYFNANWSLFQPSYPSLSVSYGLGSSAYEVLGSATQGNSDSRIFSLHSGYQLLGFNLTGGFSDFKLTEQLPEITNGSETVFGTTDQTQVQLGISRRLRQRASVVANISRSHFTVDYSGSPSKQTYDNAALSLNVTPAKGLMIMVGGAYTDNLVGQLFAPVGDGGQDVLPLVGSSSHALDLSATTTYTPFHDLSFQGTVDHRSQAYAGLDISSNDYTTGVSYGRSLGGGTFSCYGSVTGYASNVYNEAAVGGSGNVGYSRRIGGWAGSASLRYSRDTQTALASYTQSGYGYSLNGSRKLGSWIWTLGATGSENRIDSVSNSSSFNQGYSAGLSAGKLSFNGNYSRSSGNSIQTITGLVSTPVPSPIVPTTLLILYGGKAYGGAVGYTPLRGLVLTADYSHARYHTQNDSSFANNLLQQADAKADWYFRRLHFTAGYSRLLQGFGSDLGTPVRVNSFYVGIIRSMHFF